MRVRSRSRAAVALLAFLVCATTVAIVALAHGAPKYVDSFIGANSGTTGGLFNTPRDVAVNEATDQLYVVDDANHRIQRFDQSGTFKLAWGADVVQAGGSGDTGTGFETCTVASECKAGIAGTEGGPMDNPQGIAIDQDSGDVYVTDRDNLRIQRFDADGNFELAFGWDVVAGGATGFETCTVAADCKAGVSGAGAGQLASSTLSYRLAVSAPDGDPATGSVFVADAPNRRVQQFGLDGSFRRAWGWGVASGGNQFEVCAATCRDGLPTQSSSPNGQFANGHPVHVAVDSRGVVYASDSGGQNRVLRFDATQTAADPLLKPAVNPAALTGTLSSTTSGLELDPDSDGGGPDVDRLLVSRSVAIGTLELTLGTDPDDPPTHTDTHLRASNVQAEGLGINAALGRLYVPSISITNGHRVWIADEDGAGDPPILTIQEPTNVGAHSASFSGTVNPNGPAGFPTSYRFQYSKSGSTWTDVGPRVDVGDGTSPVPVSADVTGLEANTLYRVRLVAAKAFGNPEVPSPEATFVTRATAPDVQTFHPRRRAATSVQLTGQIDPGGLATEYRFEYGTSTSYGSAAPVPRATLTGGLPTIVSTTVEGLEPDTIYHYRLVAQNEDGTGAGEDVAFRTRGHSDAPPARIYEMVTPPVKATTSVGSPHIPGLDANPGLPSLDGERVLWSISSFPLTETQAFPWVGEIAVAGRGQGGWTTSSLLTKTPLEGSEPGAGSTASLRASSGDFGVGAWRFALPLLTNDGVAPLLSYTRRDGTGASGFSGWLRNVDAQQVGNDDEAIFSDDGSWMARWGRYRGLIPDDPATPAAEDPSVSQLAGSAGGSTVYLQADPPTGGIDLVSECTGTAGADATQIPARFDNGTPATGDDLIGTRACGKGAVTSVRGAVLGANSGIGATAPASAQLEGPAATAMSEGARRLFFMSPDPTAPAAPVACATGVGDATSCPPQLYVRQYDENGENAVVRWISRPAAGMPDQQIGLLGRGASFEGASRDGRYVYFRTNAPLTPDDRNGAGAPGPVTTGTASANSWDLYRYELPEDLDDDPAGGTLTRISAGPTGDADASTNDPTGAGSAARFISDDGKRAYFLTNGPIAGADATPPFGGVTTPGGAVPNPSTRNLYLFDDTKTGAARYRFVAQLPAGADDIDRCSTLFGVSGADVSPTGFSAGSRLGALSSSCFRGSRTGSTVVVLTRGQLTGDDTDSAADVYVYDADEDELVRVSAPPPGQTPYVCRTANGGVVLDTCNGGLGFGPWAHRAPGGWDTARGWGGGRRHNIAEDAAGNISVFFETRLSLLQQDTNGDHWDVYEWREGQLALVSPGNSGDHSYFSGVSEDGQDAFINTTARIDPREISDKDFDVYNARVGGGFPYSPPPPPCDVLAGACGGSVFPAPAGGSPGTSTFTGAGDEAPRRRATPACSGPSKKLKSARRKLARADDRRARNRLRKQVATLKRKLARCRRSGK